ncbi:hypothetical protein EJ03DRAFT_105360 [Teratosphaeria nubilosa]|uniref:DUF6594 domain-containing protein n=1 Tax=Teratosphaeria nubilosa TaxID=161662 RepID=A0A6G1LLE5_9PEZI|nr:hypothetical protein EJ03DRAFT_105360 [Teratosphaeria nubilosa]
MAPLTVSQSLEYHDTEKTGEAYSTLQSVHGQIPDTVPKFSGCDHQRAPSPQDRFSISGRRLSHACSPDNLNGKPISQRPASPGNMSGRGSPNYSRPNSRLSTIVPIAECSPQQSYVKLRRSSDSATQVLGRAQYRRPGSSTDSVRPIFANMSTTLPPFAPKGREDVFNQPLPLEKGPEPLTRRKRRSTTSRSMDLLEAAKHVPWANPTWRSVESLVAEKSRKPAGSFAQRVFEAGKADLMYDLRTTQYCKDRVQGVLDLGTLQRMSQYVLQQKLTEQVKAIGDKGAWMEIGIRQTLHAYCQAVQDMEYIEKCALRGTKNDPFLISTADPMECKLLEDAGLAFGDPKKQMIASNAPDRLGYTKRGSLTRRGLGRLIMAFLGGMAVIGPFLLMFLVRGQLVRIISACVFMAVFAVAITICSDLGPDRIALATAAYAAALILFVANDPPAFPTS